MPLWASSALFTGNCRQFDCHLPFRVEKSIRAVFYRVAYVCPPLKEQPARFLPNADSASIYAKLTAILPARLACFAFGLRAASSCGRETALRVSDNFFRAPGLEDEM